MTGIAESRFLRGVLNLRDDLVPPIKSERLVGDVENRPDTVLDDCLLELGWIDFYVLVPAGDDHLDRELGHLPNFFFERHPFQQVIDSARVVAFGTGSDCSLEILVAVVEISLGVNCGLRLKGEAQ